LTWDDYQQGLEVWRRNQRIVVRPTLGAPIDPLPNRKHIGYVGTDFDTGQRYKQGLRRLRSNRPSRWGFGMYVTDNPTM
jgi:magnesium-dependent phosphatase 1